MRTSSYNIVQQLDTTPKRYALLNGYTHAFDIINQDVYEYLKSNGENGDISEETKDKLVSRGYMTSLSKEDELELVKQLLNKMYDEVRLKHFGYHFIISYDCNLRCIYCYEDPILNGCTCLPKSRITKEQVDKAYEIIVEKDKEKKGDKQITLYGGEPFLKDNYEMVKYIVEKGKMLGYRFSATSNGYDIDQYLDFLEQNRIFKFQITIDGVEDIHNSRKPHFKNNDSFTKIANNVDSLLKIDIPVAIRINTDSYSMERIDELIDYFKQRGWLQKKHFSAYCALLRSDVPITDGGNISDKSTFTQSEFYKRFCCKKTGRTIYEKIVLSRLSSTKNIERIINRKKHFT